MCREPALNAPDDHATISAIVYTGYFAFWTTKRELSACKNIV